MNCKPNNSCCSPTQQWKEILLNTQDKAIQAYNLAQQALDEIENLPAGGGSVQSVNGELPDQDGDVTVDTGVLTVNGVSPDADGEVTITAGSNITITPDADTNSIEISASGGSLSADAPLEIVNDTIKLKGWTLYTNTDWSGFVSGGITTEDLYIVSNHDNAIGETFVPKGTIISSDLPRFDAIAYNISGTPTLRVCIAPLAQLVGSGSQVAFSGLRLDVALQASSGGTIDENIIIGSTALSSNVTKRTALDNNKGIRLFTRS